MKLNWLFEPQRLNPEESQLCDLLASMIERELTDAENKIWHAHPEWFLNENPIVPLYMYATILEYE